METFPPGKPQLMNPWNKIAQVYTFPSFHLQALATSTVNFREMNTFRLNPMMSLRNYDLKNTSQIEDDKMVRQLKLEALKVSDQA